MIHGVAGFFIGAALAETPPPPDCCDDASHRHSNPTSPRERGEVKDRPRRLLHFCVPILREARSSPHTHVGKVQLFSSLVAAMTSRASSGPGTAGLDAKMSHGFLIWSAGSAVTAYISCINW